MKELHPHSPEERRKRLARIRARFGREAIEKAKRDIKPLIIAKRVAIGIYDDGFIHAGNLAYLALLALFPFLILAAAISRLVGRSADAGLAVASMAVIVASVVLLLIAFAVNFLLSSLHHFVTAKLPFSLGLAHQLGIYRIVPALTLFGTFYVIFLALTPARYRTIECRKWPGA